jgi:thiol-disulfide isomerase/thioredoxin
VTLVERLGLALVRPRAALAGAGNRDHAGRSGTDLLIAIAVMVVVTQLRAIVSAVWLGAAVEATLGLRALVQTLTDVLAIDLGFLLLGTLAIWAASGPRRDLGRASDLSCVAVLPLVFVELVATVIVLALGLEVPRGVMTVLSLGAYMWTGVLVALAISVVRAPAPPVDATAAARRAGWGIVAVAAAGLVVQAVWMVRYIDTMQPVMAGEPAPPFALPRIEAKGALGPRVELESARGKVVVLDFWATWCGPCIASLPRLDAFARKHPEVVVLTVNLDDAEQARAIFDERGFSLTLLAADQDITRRYSVTAIPHTVLIDPQGLVRAVHRGGSFDLEREIAALR